MNYRATSEILDDIRDEREEQDVTWGPQVKPWFEWVSILTEEVGEVAQEINQAGSDTTLEGHRALYRAYRELVQVAAVAVAMMEQIENGEVRVR